MRANDDHTVGVVLHDVHNADLVQFMMQHTNDVNINETELVVDLLDVHELCHCANFTAMIVSMMAIVYFIVA